MTPTTSLLQAALDLVGEAVVILDADFTVVQWNAAAAEATGYRAHSVLGRPCPEFLEQPNTANADSARISIPHRLGHPVAVILRRAVLRDDLGERIGAALLFHPVEDLDTLPHGEAHGAAIERSQAELEERLDAAFHQFTGSAIPFGLLWISVDQAHTLRRTHGREACESMLSVIEHTLSHQMKPSETLGRWGDNEFLVLSHERTPELLHEHAVRLLGLARTADFRWWGDRVALTLSVGSSFAAAGDTLHALLARAQQAAEASQYAGGNHLTPGRSA